MKNAITGAVLLLVVLVHPVLGQTAKSAAETKTI